VSGTKSVTDEARASANSNQWREVIPQDATTDEWLSCYENHVPFSRDETLLCRVPTPTPNQQLPDGTAMRASVVEVREPARSGPPVSSSTLRRLRFEFHKTTNGFGHLLVAFRDIETGQLAIRFFNVSLHHQRGEKAGLPRKTGIGGQFYPIKYSKFLEWWRMVQGKGPTRLANAWKELRPRMKDIVFEAEVVVSYQTDRAGRSVPYLKIVSLPLPVRSSDNLATDSLQSDDMPSIQGSDVIPF
jgi:hypothetical protein